MSTERIIPLVITEDIHGEWWIMDGQAYFADGDSGDMNHEMYAVDALVREVGDALGIDYDEEFASADEMTSAIRNIGKDVIVLLREAGFEHPDEVWGCLTGYQDARTYAMERWGWQRVTGNNIETWNLTANDMDSIVSGLSDIVELDESEELTIYVYSLDRSFDYTYGQLLQGVSGTNAEVDWQRQAAIIQAREADINAMHPYYRGLASPIGDSTEKPGQYI